MNGDLAVIDVLRNNVLVAGFIGGTGVNNARVFLSDAPQGAPMPFIIVDVYDTEPFDTKDGVSVTDHDLVKTFAYAETSKQAVDLADAMRTALDEKRGTFNGKTVINIRYMRYDGYNVDLINRKAYVREQDYQVRIKN